ncbi:MAG: PKD domain-containing protein [Spirochaetales bacterium]|nr:PKD domain-containing protein [Spirochaetales bacterium]
MKKHVTTGFLFLGIFLFFSCPPEPPVNTPPEVTVSASAASAANGEEVTFTAAATDADGDTLAYSWYVDEAPQSGETAATFVFSAAPADETVYTIKVAVSDGSDTDSAQTTLTVAAPLLLHFMYYDDTDSTWKASDIPSPPMITNEVVYLQIAEELLIWTDDNKLLVYDETGGDWDDTGMTVSEDTVDVSRDLDSDMLLLMDDEFVVRYRDITYSAGQWTLEDVVYTIPAAPSTLMEICGASGGVLGRLSDDDTLWYSSLGPWVDSDIAISSITVELPFLSSCTCASNVFYAKAPQLRLSTGQLYTGDGTGAIISTDIFCPENTIETFEYDGALMVLCSGQ